MERNRLQEDGKSNTQRCSLAGHSTGRKLLATLAIAAGSSLAFAGGEECIPRKWYASASPSNANAVSAKALTGPLSTAVAPGGYCPGGLSDEDAKLGFVH